MRRHGRLILLAALLGFGLVAVPGAFPAEAVEMDCYPGANSWTTLSAFSNGQVFEGRACTEQALSGQYAGKLRAHIKVRCRTGTYGPDPLDYCNIIYGDNTATLLNWERAQQVWKIVDTKFYGTGTYNDSSADYYTDWDCPFVENSAQYKSTAGGLQAQSNAGQIGADHSITSYIAEVACGIF